MPVSNRINWLQLEVDKPERAAASDCELFGWQLVALPLPGEDSPGTRCLPASEVPDLESTVQTAVRLGADVRIAPTSLGRHERFSVLYGPSSSLFGIVEQV